jgi:hypothetical protein
MITAVSADGTDVRAFDDGGGTVILVVHPHPDRADHSAHLKAPGEVAHVIENLASRVLE